jgi:hypothetical protein
LTSYIGRDKGRGTRDELEMGQEWRNHIYNPFFLVPDPLSLNWPNPVGESHFFILSLPRIYSIFDAQGELQFHLQKNCLFIRNLILC